MTPLRQALEMERGAAGSFHDCELQCDLGGATEGLHLSASGTVMPGGTVLPKRPIVSPLLHKSQRLSHLFPLHKVQCCPSAPCD